MNNKNKKIIIIFGILIVIITISILIISQEKERKEDSVKTQKTTDIEKVVDRRRVEVSIDKKFDVDREKLAFKTNENGEFHATYILTHNTQTEEKIIIYAMTDESVSPLIMEVNGKNTAYHMVEVPKKGEVKVDFTLLGLPIGKHIIYIFSEKYIDKKVSDELEKTQTQKVFAGNYFSLEVLNGNNPLKLEDSFIPVERIADSYKGDLLSMHLYGDPELSSEVSSVENKHYYLMINNSTFAD